MSDPKEKMTLEKLAQMSQREFLAIRGDTADIRAEMATKQELAAVHEDLKSAITSSGEHIVEEIKTFMQPHIKSLDTVLVDVENLKEKIKT